MRDEPPVPSRHLSCGLLASGDPPGWNEVGAVAETLGTIRAIVGSLATVDELVPDLGQGGNTCQNSLPQ